MHATHKQRASIKILGLPLLDTTARGENFQVNGPSINHRSNYMAVLMTVNFHFTAPAGVEVGIH